MYKLISVLINLFSYAFIIFPKKYDILLLQKFKAEKSLNYVLLEEEFSDLQVKYVYSPRNKLIQLILDLYYTQVSSVVILDSYSLCVSNVKRIDKKLVIQIWHALGALKKFGYQSLDTKNGRSSELAYGLKMHKNYSFVVSPGTATTEFYKQAFCCNVREFVLPVVSNYKEVSSSCNHIKKVLYLPTYRSQSVEGYNKLLENLDSEYELVFKPHPNDLSFFKSMGVKICEKRTEDAIKECDLLITDYSATCYDAYLMGKQIVFYLWDYETYCLERGINIDFSQMKNVCYDALNINDVINSLEENDFSDYLNATKTLVEFLKDTMKN